MNTDKKLTGGRGGQTPGRVFFLCCLLFGLPAWAGDINKGYTFAPSEKNVTHTKLNSLVDGATINGSFVTDKSVSAPAAADSFLLYSAIGAGLRRASFDSMFLSNTNLIGSQNELNTPATNDYVLLLSSSTGLFARSSLNALTWTNNDLINSRLEITNPPPANLQFLVASNGVYDRIGLTNVFREWWRWGQFSTNTYYDVTPTNTSLLSLYTRPTNADQLLIWDAHNGTNKAITLAGLMTNPPSASALTNTDGLLLFSTVTNAANPYGTNAVFAKVNLGAILGWLTNNPAPLASSNSLPVNVDAATLTTIATGKMIDVTNSSAQVPQFVRAVLVCQTADQGYAVGDEIPAEGIFDAGGGVNAFQPGATSTNLFLLCSEASTLRGHSKTTGAQANLLGTRWKAKIYARWFP